MDFRLSVCVQILTSSPTTQLCNWVAYFDLLFVFSKHKNAEKHVGYMVVTPTMLADLMVMDLMMVFMMILLEERNNNQISAVLCH